MGRIIFLLYGGLSYLIFVGVLLYTIGFVGDLLVPKSLDTGPEGTVSASVLMDVLLLALFAVPHSIMARPRFKAWWTRIVPPPAERSTYVLVSSLLLALLFWQWRPLPAVVWEVAHPVGRITLYGLFWTGWGISLWSTFLIDHFDLCGLRQVYLHVRGRPYQPLGFRTPALYRLVRHPVVLGFLIAFWATPRMTAGHLLFALTTTAYTLVAVRWEERDLVAMHGEAYREYQRHVGTFLPVGVFKRR
jgi:protein-S-isoprenylcysteine O-methyltransferase Ste14